MAAYDAIVAGAGPAGSTAALLLARRGASVLLLDRAEFPRDKPCGGGVTVRAFKQAPVDLAPVVERQVHRVRFSFREGAFFDYTFPETLVHMTQRRRLDTYLVEQAVAAGASFRGGETVRGVEIEGAGVAVRVGGEVCSAAVLIGADGANSVVARSAGLASGRDRGIAMEAHFPRQEVDDAWDGAIALDLGGMPGGYGWSFPKVDHFNVGSAGWESQARRMRDHVNSLQRHYGLTGVASTYFRGHHLPTRTDAAAITRGRVLLAGDAAGLVDPMSGEGIYAAFVSGRLASEAVAGFLEGTVTGLEGYEAAVERELMQDIRAAAILRDAYHFWTHPCYIALRRSDVFRRWLCHLVLGEVSYTGFLARLGPLERVLRLWAAGGRARRRMSERAAAHG